MTTTIMQKAAGAINSNGLTNHTNPADSRTGDPSGQAQDGNAVANLIAHLALAGHRVNPSASGGYLVSKYIYTHHAKNFAELQAFARKLGVSQ